MGIHQIFNAAKSFVKALPSAVGVLAGLVTPTTHYPESIAHAVSRRDFGAAIRLAEDNYIGIDPYQGNWDVPKGSVFAVAGAIGSAVLNELM